MRECHIYEYRDSVNRDCRCTGRLDTGDINKAMRNSVVGILSDEGEEFVFTRTKGVHPKKFNSAESTLSKVYAKINRIGEFATGNQREAYD